MKKRKFIHRRLKLETASQFVNTHHRHCPPLNRHIFSIGAYEPKDHARLVGVATVKNCSSAWSKRTDHIELARLCTLDVPNVASFLIGKVSTAVFAMGYRCIITYTQPYESGASLKATGFFVQSRSKMVLYENRIEGGLLQWAKAADCVPSREDQEETDRILERTRSIYDRWLSEFK